MPGGTENNMVKMDYSNMRISPMHITKCIFIIVYEKFAYFLPFSYLRKSIKEVHISRPGKIAFIVSLRT